MISFDRRAVLGAALGVGVWASPVRAAASRAQLRPEFGSRQAAIDTAECAASEKFRQWENGCGMARAAQKLARGRALHSRLLAYIEVHDLVFRGPPTPAHVIAVTQLISRRTEFAGLWDCQAPFDACGCSRCFPRLWRKAKLTELERPNEISAAMQRAEAAELMLKTWIYPLAAAQHAYCKFEEPVQRPAGTTTRYYTLAFAASRDPAWRSIGRDHSGLAEPKHTVRPERGSLEG